MKIAKGLMVFLVMTVMLGSCFDPPVYPDVPKIEFVKVEFIDSQLDSLNIYLNFQDGNGDLGLAADDPLYRSAPFNDAFFYQENNGQLRQLETYSISSQVLDIIRIDDPASGKLVFPRTRKKPAYASVVPNYVFPYTCSSFNYRKILIEKEDAAVLDSHVVSTPVNIGGKDYLEIQDTLYFTPNPNHYNIEVDFLINLGVGPDGKVVYDEYDFRTDGCDRVNNVGQTYDARFPFLLDDETTLEGKLKYGMYSLGFTNIFGSKTMKLRVKIRDRALNESNVVESHDFTLQSIKKGG